VYSQCLIGTAAFVLGQTSNAFRQSWVLSKTSLAVYSSSLWMNTQKTLGGCLFVPTVYSYPLGCKDDRCAKRRRSVSRKLGSQDRFPIALKRLWALLGRPGIDVCVEDGGSDIGFADVRYCGTISPLISLPLSFFYFRCVLVLLKLAGHGNCAANS
jgi:hypothetical protein